MTLIAFGLLLLGTANGWFARTLYDADRKRKALDRMMAEARKGCAKSARVVDVITDDFTDEAWFTERHVTIMPDTFDGRA